MAHTPMIFGETFLEEREVVRETEPYHGGNIDGKDKGPELGLWEWDLRSQFPALYVPYKETRVKIPRRGAIACPTCNADQEPGFYKQNQMSQCPACYGQGLIAHRDGSDTMKTLSTRKVSVTSGAASVPDDIFHRAKGIQLCDTQASQCSPAFFADSFFLNQFSFDVIQDRPFIPPTARVICERHMISVVPVTRVTMSRHRQFFSFYIVGLSQEVYLKDYYPARFCWGLCPCLEWLKK
ncbi:hypothetical protein Goari_018106 [Gossypium aridum]|uniref:Uncharacterized protein n=1 Tax=Gossypium aridum TaxID=34290 RepID=A0A7J8WNL2_GOSAI|nr:hypothetical protein [Gossypium aridum]